MTRNAILVTGAASGIGLAAAERFVRECAPPRGRADQHGELRRIGRRPAPGDLFRDQTGCVWIAERAERRISRFGVTVACVMPWFVNTPIAYVASGLAGRPLAISNEQAMAWRQRFDAS